MMTVALIAIVVLLAVILCLVRTIRILLRQRSELEQTVSRVLHRETMSQIERMKQQKQLQWQGKANL